MKGFADQIKIKEPTTLEETLQIKHAGIHRKHTLPPCRMSHTSIQVYIYTYIFGQLVKTTKVAAYGTYLVFSNSWSYVFFSITI